MENKIIITNYSSSFGEHEYLLNSLRKSIQTKISTSWWHLMKTQDSSSGDNEILQSRPKCWYQSTHRTSNSEPRHRPRGGSRGEVRGSTNKVRRVHPLGNMNPSNRRSEILTVPSRGSDESSVIQRLSNANFNQSDQQLTSVPTSQSAERRQKTSFPESFFVLIDLMLKRLR